MALTTYHGGYKAYSVMGDAFIKITARYRDGQYIQLSPEDLLSILRFHAPELLENEQANRIA